MHNEQAGRSAIPLPLSPTSYRLASDQLSSLSDAAMADVEFGPWELSNICEVPTLKQWKIAQPQAFAALIIAAKIVQNDKDTLIESTKKLNDEALDQITEAIDRWVNLFRMHLAMLETAQIRMMIAFAVLAKEHPSDS